MSRKALTLRQQKARVRQFETLCRAAKRTGKIQCAKAVAGGGHVGGKPLPVVCCAPNSSIRFYEKMPTFRW